ncbi:hypothetical protein THTE_3281 [Thermogutta terrifontis]|uniref:Uncharacterized protein n=1 Tax=Thermogutta terrifontis TaxID=1331910 RepID=A0A286RIV3_9BACT|nr:hypothetical protein THTE_3281 [Thermogutta terrifontis]
MVQGTDRTTSCAMPISAKTREMLRARRVTTAIHGSPQPESNGVTCV